MYTAQNYVKKIIKAGHTQTYISNKTGVTQSTISRILNGEHQDPKSSTFLALRKLAERCTPSVKKR